MITSAEGITLGETQTIKTEDGTKIFLREYDLSPVILTDGQPTIPLSIAIPVDGEFHFYEVEDNGEGRKTYHEIATKYYLAEGLLITIQLGYALDSALNYSAKY